MTTLTEEILSSIGYLAEITIGEVIPQNDQTIRLQQLNHIIQWTNIIRQDLDAEHNLRLNLEQELNRQRTLLVREELLANIDLGIQEHMKQLSVDIKLGSQLLPRIIDIVDLNILPILQEYDALTINVDNIAHELNQAHAKIQTLQSGNPQININESQTVTNSLTIPQHFDLQNQLNFTNDRIIQLQGIIGGLQTNNHNLIDQLSVAKNKNQQLIHQIVLSNSKVQEIEKKLLQNSSKITNTTNDANAKIINDLKGQNDNLNKRIKELTQQLLTNVNSRNESETQKLTLELRNADARIKQLVDESIATNKQLLLLKNGAGSIEHVGNQHQLEHEEIVHNANQRIQELMIQYSEANNRIAELQHQLENNHNKKDQTQHRQETKTVQLASQLVHSQHRIEDLINQLSISNNRITDLELDIEAMNRQSLDKNNAIGYQRKVEVISHQLLVANNKVEQMMRIVANYQNNVIDLELDKQALIFQLNDSRNKQQQYLDQLKVERATVNTLKDQLLKIKESYYEAARGNIKAVDSQIFKRQANESIQKPSVQGQIINISQPMHLEITDKSERSYRDHSHRKIFEGKIRGSHASNRKQIFVGEK